MPKKEITLQPVGISPQILKQLDEQGLVMTFKPTPATLSPPNGENVDETLYVSDSKYGAHKLIAVGVNKTQVRLGVHGDNEEFLIPTQPVDVKPIYLVICHLPQEEIRRRDLEGTLTSEHFTCLSMHPAPRGAEMFTMLRGTVHCEATTPGVGKFGVFYVTEGDNLNIDWIDLENTEIVIR